MRILVITTKSPFPLYEGRALRTYNLLREVAKRHEIVLLTFIQTREEFDGIDKMREFCAHVDYVRLNFEAGLLRLGWDILCELFGTAPLHAVKYRSRAMRSKVRALLDSGSIDVVHLDMLHLGEYLGMCGGKPVVLTEHNVESVLLRRRAENTSNPLSKLYLYYQWLKLRAYEAKVCRRVDHVVAVSELDAKQLRELAGISDVTPISNGVDTGYFDGNWGNVRPNSLIFVGGLTWFPNYDAVRYFCAEVLPRVAAEIPDVTLTVVGKSPSRNSIRDVADNTRVRLTGLVDDVRPLIAEAAVYVVPLRVGGGTRLKILDALSMGKPLVSTSVGCEGLDVEPEKQLLVADSAEHFAGQVIRLLRDRELAQRLGRSGRELVQRVYEWRVVAKELDRVYERCVRSPG